LRDGDDGSGFARIKLCRLVVRPCAVRRTGSVADRGRPRESRRLARRRCIRLGHHRGGRRCRARLRATGCRFGPRRFRCADTTVLCTTLRPRFRSARPVDAGRVGV